MWVLVACEFSGIVRDAFIRHGHHAISCDLLASEREGPHIQADIREVLASGIVWDLMIAHPPCQYLARSGARWWAQQQCEQEEALDLVRFLLSVNVPRIALENPVGAISTHIRPPDQYIQPWQFGTGETKKTGLWLKNLPPLQPTDIVPGRVDRVHRMPQRRNRWKDRSRTVPGIAEAMAVQWGRARHGVSRYTIQPTGR